MEFRTRLETDMFKHVGIPPEFFEPHHNPLQNYERTRKCLNALLTWSFRQF